MGDLKLLHRVHKTIVRNIAAEIELVEQIEKRKTTTTTETTEKQVVSQPMTKKKNCAAVESIEMDWMSPSLNKSFKIPKVNAPPMPAASAEIVSVEEASSTLIRPTVPKRGKDLRQEDAPEGSSSSDSVAEQMSDEEEEEEADDDGEDEESMSGVESD